MNSISFVSTPRPSPDILPAPDKNKLLSLITTPRRSCFIMYSCTLSRPFHLWTVACCPSDAQVVGPPKSLRQPQNCTVFTHMVKSGGTTIKDHLIEASIQYAAPMPGTAAMMFLLFPHKLISENLLRSHETGSNCIRKLPDGDNKEQEREHTHLSLRLFAPP